MHRLQSRAPWRRNGIMPKVPIEVRRDDGPEVMAKVDTTTDVPEAPPNDLIISEVLSDGILYNPSVIQPSDVRSDGIHLSAVIQDLWYKRIKGYDSQNITEAAAILEAGFTWEELLEHAFGYRQFRREALLGDVRRPGEQHYDWAFMTPDGYSKSQRAIHEFKLTTKSASKMHNFMEEFKNYVWQAAGYCLALKCTKCVFWIMFIGRAQFNKEDAWKPARVYRIEYEFTPLELESHWNTLTNHKNWMVQKGLLVPHHAT